MPEPVAHRFSTFKGSGWTALARVQNPDGANITQSTITSIACSVTDANGDSTYSNAALTVSAVVFNSLQTAGDDSRWTGDSTGFNFAFEVPASAFAATGHHMIVFTFTPTAGEVYKLVYEGSVRSA